MGRIGAAPLNPDQQFQFTISTQGRLTSTEEFERIIIRANPDGSTVRVRDVARVELGAEASDRFSRFDGNPGASIAIYQAPGANAVDVAEKVAARMEELSERFPDDLESLIVYDTTLFVKASIEEVMHTLVEAFALVALVVFVFLGKLRTTIIPLIAVPVSIIGTFAVLLLIGYSANTVSLLALVLSIGIVVDDAIIVIENVERVMEEEPHLSVKEATRKAMTEITGPILAVTMVLLSVFVPVAFLPGISGELFRQFAVTVSTAMLISAVNALTLSPALCSVLLKHGPRPKGPIGWMLTGIDKMAGGYTFIVRRLVRVSIVSLVLVAAAAAGTWGVFRVTPQGFLPSEDQGGMFVILQIPEGASLNRTSEVSAQVEAIMREDPAVEHVVAVVGLDFISGTVASNSALIVSRLKDYEERPTPDLGVEAVIERARPKLAALTGRHRRAAQPPADHRPRLDGRLRVRAAGAPGTAAGRHRGRGQGHADRGQPGPGAGRRLLHLRREHAAALSRHRPREGADARGRDRRHLRCAPGHARGLLRERLQPVRPNLAGQHPGGYRLPVADRRHLPGSREEQPGPDGADEGARRGPAGPRSPGADPVQQLPRRHHQRRRRAGPQHRRGARRHGAPVGDGPSRRLRLRMDRDRAAGEGGRRTDRHRARARGHLRLPLPGRALRELERADPGPACRSSSPYSARSRRCG